jgi:3-hydroxyacyl-CoA dehydrogenase
VIDENRAIRRVSELNDKVEAARGHPEIFEKFRKDNARKLKGFEAPEACIQAVEAAVNLPFREGLALERQLFMKLIAGTQSAAQRHIFFAERQTTKVPDIADDTPTLPIAKVGVIGAGTMGGGISMNFLNTGIPVKIVETKQEALDRGLATIRKNYENTAKKGRLTQDDVEKRMGLLTPSMNLEDLADCDLIIEAVFELMEIKQEVFGKLDRIAKPGAILASNTSYLDIDVIAASTSRPESVIGLHFFSPANVMRLLEIVRGAKTDKSVIATSMQIGKTIGKVAVLVGNCHGFVGNRMLAQRQREAMSLILEGAMPWDVDRVLYDFGLPMGPFAMSDLAGLDIGWDPAKTSSSTIREVLCEMDRRGQKNGKGFYDYDENRVAKPSAEVEKVILDFAEKRQIQRRQISDQEILERCLYPMVNEGAKILEEGKAIRASDIDTVWINGYGWPVYTGGPMFWGELVGLDKVLAGMKAFQEQHGDDFKPSALLERLVAEGKGFKDA